MTMPTAPTATSLVTEALTRFLNGGVPDPDEVTRGIDYGLEKVKRDIMGLGKTWKPLLHTTFKIASVGLWHYDNPTDFEKYLSVGLMDGTHTGALINVAGAAMTLSPTENALPRECVGKWLLITSGNGVNQARVIIDYVFATKVATLSSPYYTTPNVLDGYMIVDSIKDLNEIKIERYDQYKHPGIPGEPVRYAPVVNGTLGKLYLHPVPDAVYGLQLRYFIDLMKLDVSSTRYPTILRRWANIFEQGVFVWKLAEDDDRYETENQSYQSMLITLMAHDLYGFDPVAAGLAKGKE
jgi:hypothetical protein